MLTLKIHVSGQALWRQKRQKKKLRHYKRQLKNAQERCGEKRKGSSFFFNRVAYSISFTLLEASSARSLSVSSVARARGRVEPWNSRFSATLP